MCATPRASSPPNSHSAHPRLGHLLAVTPLPTAAGQEWRVERYIEQWAEHRGDVSLARDEAGNITVTLKAATPTDRPLFITAHLDHPAFVVERIIGPGTVELSFRGGVMGVFFKSAAVQVFTRNGFAVPGTLTSELATRSASGEHYVCELEGPHAREVSRLDIGRWLMPAKPRIDEQGILHTPACDDLSAVAAALQTIDELLASAKQSRTPPTDTRLLFTRAEEIGFIGAIAATKAQTMPRESLVIALENSRAFDDSPVGGGPIVRVGDRISVFTPWLTAACAARAEAVFGGASTPRASETAASIKKRPWQRKLMAGGACEASVFCQGGYDATCICLPLGNYHNMPHLDAHQAGTYDEDKHGPARCEPEFIHTEDYLGMVDLLVALAKKHPGTGDSGFAGRLDKLLGDCRYVLDER